MAVGRSAPTGSERGSNGTRSVPTTYIHLAPPAARRERGLERSSPSSLEGGSRISAASILAGQSPEALAVGTLFHAWLAEIEWLDNDHILYALPDDGPSPSVGENIWVLSTNGGQPKLFIHKGFSPAVVH